MESRKKIRVGIYQWARGRRLLRLMKYEGSYYSAEGNTNLAGVSGGRLRSCFHQQTPGERGAEPCIADGGRQGRRRRGLPAAGGTVPPTRQRSGLATARVRRIWYLLDADYSPAGACASTDVARSQRASATPVKPVEFRLWHLTHEAPLQQVARG